MPIIVKGEGHKIWDSHGREYIDGLAGLFVVQVGHGREELAEAAAKQAASWPSSRSGPSPTRAAIELADRLAAMAPRRPQPGLLHHRRRRGRRVGLEAGQAVLQAHRQAQQAQGHLPRHGLPRHPAGRAVHHRHPAAEGDVRAAGARCATRCPTPTSTAAPTTSATTRRRSVAGPRTGSPRPSSSRAPTPWPPSSSSRSRTPAAASRRRPATSSGCARSATSTTCCSSPTRSSAPSAGWGRCSAAHEFGYQPDIITCAKGMTSGYSPIGAMIATDRLFEPFKDGTTSFAHGYTFGGHPVSPRSRWPTSTSSSAKGSSTTSAERARPSAPPWRSCSTCPSSVTSAAHGYFYGIELVKDRDDQGDLRRRRVRAAAARLPLRRAVRGRPLLPRRRPRRPGHPARPTADHRPARVRRHRAAAAVGAHRSARAPLTPTCVRGHRPGRMGG